MKKEKLLRKMRKRWDIKTVRALDETLTGTVKISGSTALRVLGASWNGFIELWGSINVLGVNLVPLVDCSRYFFSMRYLPSADRVLCAKPYRAYLELVYNRLLSPKPCCLPVL